MKSIVIFGIATVLFIMAAIVPMFPIPSIAFFMFGAGFGVLFMEIKYEKRKV